MPPNRPTSGDWKQSFLSKLTPKALVLLLALGLVLVAGVLVVAVISGRSVDVLGIKINPYEAPKTLSIGTQTKSTASEPMPISAMVNCTPAEFNPRAPGAQVTGYIKSLEGQIISLKEFRWIIEQGGIRVETKLPDKNTPFYIELRSPSGKIWRSDDYSPTQFYVTAYQQPALGIN